MYELLSRELLIISYFNTSKGAKLGLRGPEDYAEKVCEGFRPPRPACLSDAAWSLLSACWHDDPVQRPPMKAVAERLAELRAAEKDCPTDPRGLSAFSGCTAGCSLQ
ncbi:hypothetical protein PLESTB_000971200 [Pleodorina starrii]|uniref:Serine-threonine/tyrosine-protein kinase catalytic domain-containing protein n=1 Tax=Pleodorina starrii TaxID=330485 RepID=A0A9W6BPT6_9CHLO|nr:hypothetical protein PLESTM_001635400 [Pleodorina starrii]GLC44720.1 hypothetical protein PLESTM_001635500 [Pleodorina starrii]GLC55311.1 hypothetical protein PLESTB_000971200 [Pleodorina starrii]GLC76325.1 hypothetical protein PLESTF_001766800 [Pleodorina starrii]